MLTVLKACIVVIRSRDPPGILRMTGSAVLRQALVNALPVAALAAGHGVSTQERKAGRGMMELRHRPECLRMTAAAWV
jgi:hypothetical protein